MLFRSENVYREDEDEMHTDHEEMGADNPKMRNPRMQPGKVDYAENKGVSYKTNPAPGKVAFGYKPETPGEKDGTEGRYDTGKSAEQSDDRYKTGKTSFEQSTFGRDDVAVGMEQHQEGRVAVKNSEQDEDRRKTGKYIDPDDEGRYTDMSHDQMYKIGRAHV